MGLSKLFDDNECLHTLILIVISDLNKLKLLHFELEQLVPLIYDGYQRKTFLLDPAISKL